MNCNIKGGKHQGTTRDKFCSHVAAYYSYLAKNINTGCPMSDYCVKDVYITESVRNMK